MKRYVELRFVVLSFLVWRGFLFLVAWLASSLVPLRDAFLGCGTVHYRLSPVLCSQANFDGVPYLMIAERGYGAYQQAFFPLYPLLIRYLSPVFGGNLLMTGLVITNLSFLIALLLLYQLIRLHYSKENARMTILSLLLFPTSFFFGAVYTESLFLCLSVASFYLAYRKKWILGSLFSSLASATRLTGVTLLVPLTMIAFFRDKGRATFLKIVSLMLVPVGLLAYMRYLKLTHDSYFFFFQVQPAFGAGRSGGEFIFLPQVFWRYFQIFLTVSPRVYEFWIAVGEIVFFLLACSVLILFWKRLNTEYAIYAGIGLLIPTLTGTFLSIPRFVITLFPVFLAFAFLHERMKKLGIVFLAVSGVLLLVASSLFYTGYWIS